MLGFPSCAPRARGQGTRCTLPFLFLPSNLMAGWCFSGHQPVFFLSHTDTLLFTYQTNQPAQSRSTLGRLLPWIAE